MIWKFTRGVLLISFFHQKKLDIPDERFHGGMSMGAVGGGAPVAAAVVEPPKEKEAFDIKLGAVDQKVKIKIIKEVRTITGLGLKEVRIFIYGILLDHILIFTVFSI